MAAGNRANFEIQVQRDGRWITETVSDREDDARTIADKFFADKRCEGARIVRNWNRADGKMVESELFCQTRIVKDDGPVRIAQVDTAPAKCEAPDDYFGPSSRGLMNRIFRNYFEKTYLTPTELIHNYRELKRIQDKDTLVPSAVDRVAFLQTREIDQDSKSRRDEIFKTLDQMTARARKAEAMGLPKLAGNFSEVIQSIEGVSDDDERDYLALVVLSRDLINVRNWVGKLERLCKLAQDEGDFRAVQLLDGAIADVLGANVVQEILGWQPSLGNAIRGMLDLADGIMPTEKSEAGESAVILNRMFAARKLPLARHCLIDRAHRQLRSANALYRTDPAKENDEFRRVLQRLLTPTGLYCGAETAEALTTRYTRMVEQGGAAGRRAAIAGVFQAMPDKATGAMFLCDLARSEYAKDHAGDIVEQLETLLQCRSIVDLCLRTLSPKDRMIRATNAHQVMVSSVFPSDVKGRVVEAIDSVLERYVIEEQIVEKLDHPDSSLRDRAVRLVQFCAAGVLPEGRALSRARQRILALLRQPNFDAHFVDGIADPGRAQKALRDFHALLVKAGFGG